MKTFRLKDLIDNKDNPKIVKKILDSTELSKLDKKDLLKDLKGVNTNKEELILDSDTIQQKCYFVRLDTLFSLYQNGFPPNEVWDNELRSFIQYLSYSKYTFYRTLTRVNHILGFRFNIASDNIHGNTYDIPDEILEYFIEVPFTRFYDKNTNFFYFANGDRIEAGKKLYKTLSKLNLTEGEWFVPNGYIFMITDVSTDDRGLITKVRKVGNIFEYESIINGQAHMPSQLLPTGEVIYQE